MQSSPEHHEPVLCGIGFVCYLANASCERAFSVMNIITSDWRCRLGAEILDILIRLNVLMLP